MTDNRAFFFNFCKPCVSCGERLILNVGKLQLVYSRWMENTCCRML